MAHFISDKTVLKAARVVIKYRHFLVGLISRCDRGPHTRAPYAGPTRGERERTHAAAMDRHFYFFAPSCNAPPRHP